MRSDQSIWWDDAPPLKAHVPVVSVKPSVGLVVVAAGPVVGVWTHWWSEKRQSLPCRGPGCTMCEAQRPRWKGYLPAQRTTRACLVVEVSHGAARALPMLLSPEIAGRWLKFERRGKQNNSSVVVRLSEAAAVTDVTAFDPRPILLEMWEIPQARGGV